MKARDKFWMFGVRAGQDDSLIGCPTRLARGGSKMTPAEAAFYLDVPNIIMVNCDGIPVPFSIRAEQYMHSFTPMKKVLWSSTGSGSFRCGNEEKYIVDLANRYPNMAGAFTDDVLGPYRKLPEDERNEKAIQMFSEIRKGIDECERKLDLYIVYYTLEMSLFSDEVFKDVDGLTIWTWNCEELPQLEERLKLVEDKFPDKKRMIGVYLFDFPSRKPVPTHLMELQCNLGLRLMKEGRLDGMIFEANSVMGVGLPNDEWARNWIADNGDTEVPD